MSFEQVRLHIFSDFDGTITQQDTLVFLATRLGGGAEMVATIGRLIRSGELSLRDGIAAEMRSIRVPFAAAEALLRAEVQLDPTFKSFAAWCEQAALPLTILSAGFAQSIELFLPRAEFPQIERLANELIPDAARGWHCVFRDQSDWGHDKTVALRAAQAGGETTVFIGDGLSDRAAAEVADIVFAKHSLAVHCRERQIAFTEFETFAEVQAALQARLTAG